MISRRDRSRTSKQRWRSLRTEWSFSRAGFRTCCRSLIVRRFARTFHLAAAVGVRLVVDEPIRTIETNVHETSAVLEFARRGKVPTLIASTSEVYGKGTRTPFAEGDDVVYGPTTTTRWSYACSKAIDEYLALAHDREGLAPTVVVRFFNTVGPRQSGEYGMVLPQIRGSGLGRASDRGAWRWEADAMFL